ncbi:hypothetical protein NMY22_g2201 [Coprinellus aureogranulatus]|nr:hypothetical protein NMY22_g2201 [Coprinellus aureogranulatus]
MFEDAAPKLGVRKREDERSIHYGFEADPYDSEPEHQPKRQKEAKAATGNNPEQVKQALDDANAKKATKVRLWCLTLTLPKVSPIIVAVLPIPHDLDANALFPLLKRVLDGLIDKGIHVVSYASDGYQEPFPKRPDTRFQFTVYREQAICIIQDSKHALKTLRNNLFSGARLLTFGNSVAAYRRIRQLVDEAGSPIHKRDVEKLDRQDDNVACRLFSAGVLRYLTENHKDDSVAEIVYLFVFGELVDAFQNRKMAHDERLRLALRARYFLDAWTTYPDVAEYKKAQHHLSREALNILEILIEGLLALVIIHRDYLDGLAPLMLWLHIFGVKLREAVLYARTANGKARASGYAHTYFDNTGIDLLVLATFPSDEEIRAIAKLAAHDADALLAPLGINQHQRTAALLRQHPYPQATHPYYTSTAYFSMVLRDGRDMDSDEDHDSGDEFVSENIQQLLAINAANPHSRRHLLEETMERLDIANVSIATKRHYASVIEEVVSEEYQHVRHYREELQSLRLLAPIRIRLVSPGPIDTPLDRFDFETLVELRERHQTHQAATGICDDKGIGTGLARYKRWRWRVPARGGRECIVEGGEAPELSAGSSANAGAIAKVNAKQATASFQTLIGVQARYDPSFGTGNGREWSCQCTSTCKALTILGSSLRQTVFALVECSRSVSYLDVQVYEQHNNKQFTPLPQSTAVLNTNQLPLLPPIRFLMLLPKSAVKVEEDGWIHLDADYVAQFKLLKDAEDKFHEAVKLFNTRGPGKGTGKNEWVLVIRGTLSFATEITRVAFGCDADGR